MDTSDRTRDPTGQTVGSNPVAPFPTSDAMTVAMAATRALRAAMAMRTVSEREKRGRNEGGGWRKKLTAKRQAWRTCERATVVRGFAADTRSVQTEDARVRMQNVDMNRVFASGKKAQKTFLDNLLKVEPYAPSQDRQENALPMRIINVNRTCKVTKGGGNFRFAALVVVGNKKGGAGFGSGKGNEVPVAIDKAYAKAVKNLYQFDLYRSHTIYRKSDASFCKTKAVLMPAPLGTGIVANETIACICELAGIKDLRAKIVGSHHPHNTVKAVFKALENIEPPEVVARRRGLVAIESMDF